VAGYSSTPLSKKLGLREGDLLVLAGAPRGFAVPDLPAGVEVVREDRVGEADGAAGMIVAFFGTLAALGEEIAALGERIFPDGAVWIAWPRRAAGHQSDIREQDIRDLALPLGLVDVKVAALDEDWSGLRLVWRRERRERSKSAPRG
jgi:hypothetical protein